MKKIFLIPFLWSLSLYAHGIGSKIIENSETVSLYFYYSDGAALSYGAVKIFGPSDTDIEFQNGRTDRMGGFSFRPNETGLWLAQVSDSKDHVGTVQIMVTKEGDQLSHKLFRHR